jgi:hypothetical protein
MRLSKIYEARGLHIWRKPNSIIVLILKSRNIWPVLFPKSFLFSFIRTLRCSETFRGSDLSFIFHDYSFKVIPFNKHAICCKYGRRRHHIALVVFPHFVFVFSLHDVVTLNMIFSYSTLLRHSVEYYAKTPYLVSYWVNMTISWSAVSQSLINN